MLKNLTPEITQILLEMYNNLWKNYTYPDEWKEAVIVPILKPGKDPTSPSSYRPISLTCCLGKLLEKMIHDRLQWYLEKENLLSPYQAGYRTKRSTTDHLIMLENEIQNAFANRQHAVAVFFDIKGAFDMTWRYGILKEIYDYGIRGTLPKFIESFLKGRTFRVRVGDSLSNLKVLENGVPQGSTLSCKLFNIAINRIAENVDPEIVKCLYVDDLAIILSGKSIETIVCKLQKAIDTIIRNGESIGYEFA